jgi:DNA-binding winged helix-turn-helix (wHTH) protein
MDSALTAAGLALASGDVLGALNRVALRKDPPALALHGIAMARLGDFDRARSLLKAAARKFGPREDLARARCQVAEAEIALVSRDLSWPVHRLEQARIVLAAKGDHLNATHALCLEARRHLLLGELDRAEAVLASADTTGLPRSLRASFFLAKAGIDIRRLRVAAARDALVQAEMAARQAAIPALLAEVALALQALEQPAARLRRQGLDLEITLDTVERLLASNALVIDATRNLVSKGHQIIRLSTRPTLFSLLRILAEASPADVPRETLLSGTFNVRQADESNRLRLRVEIARLRREVRPLLAISATIRGYKVTSRGAEVALLTSLKDDSDASILALLSDGELWSSSALALALHTSPRTVQRALLGLQQNRQVQPIGRGRARRWTLPTLPGFPTVLHLPRSGA